MGLSVCKYALAFLGGISVACNDYRKITAGCRKRSGIVDYTFFVAAIGSAYEKKYVGLISHDFFRIVLSKLKRVGLDHLCTCSEACTSCRLRCKFGYKTACNHPQTAGSARCGETFGVFRNTCFLTQRAKRIIKPLVDIGRNRGVSGGRAEQNGVVYVYRCYLRICAAKVYE